MPPLALLLPVAVLLAASAAAVLLGRAGDGWGRVAAASGAWVAAAVIAGLWLPLRSTLELGLGPLGFGVSFSFRLDAVAVVFGLVILIPAALLLTLQPR